MLNNQTNKIIGIIVLALIVVLGISFMVKASENNSQNNIQTNITEWSKGGENAQVVLVEYSDFQCPACQAYSEILGELNKEFGDDLKIVYKHFPLKQIHPNATIAAQVSEAAGLQGKFWEMHDLLFSKQGVWSSKKNPQTSFDEYALELGLDIDLFKKDVVSKETKNRVNNDYTQGSKIKVNYTPYFILNGKRVDNPNSLEEFKDLIENAINQINQ